VEAPGSSGLGEKRQAALSARAIAMSTIPGPFVSVLTPVYNGAAFIAECIESVLAQTYTNFEYILVNNCSKDNTLEICREYARKDSRIRVHDNTDFLDVMVNHNHALTFMSEKSTYFKFVSGDDWIFPECVAKMVGLAVANPNVGIVGSYSIEGKRILFEGLDYEQKVVNGREICRDTLLGKHPYVFGAPTTLLYRADLARRTKTFFPYAEGAPHADVSAVYQALEHSDFGFVHQVLSYTRVHVQSETSSSFKFGKTNRALLADMARFGPRYLSPEEHQKHLDVAIDKYYQWLLPALIENSFSKDFLEIQKSGLRAIGFEFQPTRLLKATVMRGVEFFEKPKTITQKISAMMKRKGKIEARGTSLT
jgi:glycosyltransferase involved in cell wall biosynthesis